MRTVVAALALLAAVPAVADEGAPPAPDYAAMSDADLEAGFQAVLRERPSAVCEVKPLFAELRSRHPEAVNYSAGFHIVSATCAAMEGDGAAARRELAEAERTAGVEYVAPVGLTVSAMLQDGPEAFKWLRAIADNGLIAALPWQSIAQSLTHISRSTARPEYERFAYDLTTTSDFARLDPRLQATFATTAVRHAARTGNLRQVDDLLAYVHAPSQYVEMLAFRDFEKAWPAIERHAGAHLAAVTQDYVDWTSTRLIDRPEDPERLQEYADALGQAQRYRELAELGNKWLDDPKRSEHLAEFDAWALNAVANGYDGLDRHAEADAVFDRLATLPPEENPWVVNFVINRAARLAHFGRWEEALPAIELASDITARHGTAYAKATIAGHHVCVLRKLGRVADGDRALEALVPQFADSPYSVTMALRCAGRDEQAAKLIARLQRDPNENQLLLSYLQDFDLDDDEDMLPSLRDLVFAREDLRSEALKWIRLLPDELKPVRATPAAPATS
jgi:tetratricopeptide (TPR) repeat protein